MYVSLITIEYPDMFKASYIFCGKLVFTPYSRSSLKNISSFIQPGNLYKANDWLLQLEEACLLLHDKKNED